MAAVRVPAKDKLSLVSNLGTMITSGIPILDAVETMLAESKGPMKTVLEHFRDSLSEGKPLSHAMEQLPATFDPVMVNVVKAGEEAGTLEQSLADMTLMIKRDMALSDSIRASLIYPGFIMLVFGGMLALILVFVVPRIAKVFTGLKVVLPTPTKILIQVSDFLLNYYLFIIIGLILFVVGAVMLYRAKRRKMIAFLLNMPFLRSIGRQIDLTRFSRSMALLLHAGIPIGDALDLSAKVVNKKEVAAIIDGMKHAVDQGKPMSDALEHAQDIVPSVMKRIIQTAEASGTLDKTMQELADYFELQVNRSLKTITTLLEPVMIVVIGLLVGAAMLAIIAPIYNLVGQVQG